MMFDTKIEIILEPVYYQDAPRINWGLDGFQHHCEVSQILHIGIDQPLPAGKHSINIEYINKTDQDNFKPKDKAIIIRDILIEGLSTTKISQGIYRPVFPEPWATQQEKSSEQLFMDYRYSKYLGWNGQWTFEFSCPIYHWIHVTENLGFFYDRKDSHKQH